MLTKQPRCLGFLPRPFLPILLFLILPTSLMAQRRGVKPVVLSDKWQLSATVEGVQCFYRISTCANQSVVFLKFNNTNSRAVKVSWNEMFLMNEGNAAIKQNAAGQSGFELPPGTSENPDCETAGSRRLMTRPVQKSPVFTGRLVGFAYTDIAVTR